jgi:hypothetical protein
MYWRVLDPLKRSLSLSDAARVLLFVWTLGVMGYYDGGPAVHGLLIAAVILLVVPLRSKRSPSVERTSPNVAARDSESRSVARRRRAQT